MWGGNLAVLPSRNRLSANNNSQSRDNETIKETPRARRGRVSIFFDEHNRQDTGRLGRIARVLRSELHVRIVIIDLEKELASGEREIAEVVLAMRVVFFGELR